MRLVLLSDTHTKHDAFNVPDGDVLIHAGDFTYRGTRKELEQFDEWLGELPHPHKIVTFGNHELTCDPDHRGYRAGHRQLITAATVLDDDAITISNVRFWGSPITPYFCDWAFNRFRGKEIKEHWDLIDGKVDVLITHGPPFGILDQVRWGHTDHLGCEELRETVERVAPKVHVFGHIHGSGGHQERRGETLYVNAAMLDEAYRPAHLPIVVDLNVDDRCDNQPDGTKVAEE